MISAVDLFYPSLVQAPAWLHYSLQLIEFYYLISPLVSLEKDWCRSCCLVMRSTLSERLSLIYSHTECISAEAERTWLAAPLIRLTFATRWYSVNFHHIRGTRLEMKCWQQKVATWAFESPSISFALVYIGTLCAGLRYGLLFFVIQSNVGNTLPLIKKGSRTFCPLSLPSLNALTVFLVYLLIFCQLPLFCFKWACVPLLLLWFRSHS